MLTASCNGSFMQKFYQNPAHSVINNINNINRSPYQPYSTTSNLNSLTGANGSNPLNSFNNGLNSTISSSNSSINTNTPRYSTANVSNNAYGHHMQAVQAAVVASQQFNIGSNGNLQSDTNNTEDWYNKGFTSSLRINPLQYQA